jgi:acetyl esterase/lipase
LFLTIAFGIPVSWYFIMSYTPDTTLDIPPFTFVYRAVQGLQVSLDVHLPPFRQRDSTAPGDTMDSHSSESPAIVPALLYFHGGGLTVGNRKSWFPHWMQS